ncbi:hypothetical protein [Mesorhizobium sp. M0276]|uniref:hypothetical protein n=1 Tax=Mesorhizobium sp. M0276 TaxID=2956928 RepID=UPI003337BA15
MRSMNLNRKQMDLAARKITIIGLGYVALPLAVAFGATREVVGFDINQSRVDALERGEDHTLEASSDEIRAAKVTENTQRDLNIALMNELSLIFGKLGIDTSEVLEAAGTKWNFLRLTPGLVGGHCIGVDPYYLTHKAQELGYHPEVILAGRRVNDGMGRHAPDQKARLMMRRGYQSSAAGYW